MKYFSLFIVTGLVFSCANKNLKDYQPAVVQGSETVPEKEISYVNDIKPIIESRCNKCHKGFEDSDWSVFQDLQSVATTKYSSSDVDSKLLSRLKNTKYGPRMPEDGPPYLTENEITIIEKWANAGASNN